MESKESWPVRILLLLLLLFALGERLYGVGFSLPLTIHPDEPHMVDHAVITLKTGNWKPDSFNYPSGYHYLLTGVLGLQLLYGAAQGAYTSPADLPDSSFDYTSAPGTYLWARATTAVLGTLTVLLVYLVGRQLYGPTAGLAGALLLACSHLHVESSHYATTDVPMAAMAVLSLYLALRFLNKGGAGRALLAGAAVGLAGGFKYNGIVVLLPLLLVLALRAVRLGAPAEGLLRPVGRFFNRELGLAVLGMVCAYLLACPFTLGDLPAFMRDMGFQLHFYHYGEGSAAVRAYVVGQTALPPWLAYLHILARDSLLFTLAGLGGVILVLVRRKQSELVVPAFIAVYYLFTASYEAVFARNLLPALAALDVLAGGFLTWAVSRVLALFPRRRLGPYVQPVGLGLLLVLLAAQPVGAIMATDAYWARPTSQLQLRRWLDAHAAAGDRVAAEVPAVLFSGASYHVTPVDFLSNYPLESFTNHGYRYVVASSDVYGPEYARKGTLPEYYAGLLGQMEPVADLPGQPGPRLTVYQVPPGLRPQRPLQLDTAAQLQLLGFDLGKRQEEGDLAFIAAKTEFHPGKVLGLTLYMQAAAPLSEDYIISIRLVDGAGQTAVWRDQLPCAGACPPRRWQSGVIIVDQEDLLLPPTLVPGSYRLELGVLQPGSKAPLPLTTRGEGSILLSEITVSE